MDGCLKFYAQSTAKGHIREMWGGGGGGGGGKFCVRSTPLRDKVQKTPTLAPIAPQQRIIYWQKAARVPARPLVIIHYHNPAFTARLVYLPK